MKAAAGQFAVAADPAANLAQVLALLDRARDCDLLVLPEGILARDIADPGLARRVAQPLDGPFVTALRQATRGHRATVVFCLHLPGAPGGRVWNAALALRDGAIVADYRKLHLYDAFATRESDDVAPGDALPPVIEVAGRRVGIMTCYDVRFPEVARHLALEGAEVIALPAAWLRGPGKEMHWQVMATARALENTVFVVAAGECGPKNIGASLILDPLGVVLAGAGAEPALLTAALPAERLAQVRAQLPVLANRRFAAPRLG